MITAELRKFLSLFINPEALQRWLSGLRVMEMDITHSSPDWKFPYPSVIDSLWKGSVNASLEQVGIGHLQYPDSPVCDPATP